MNTLDWLLLALVALAAVAAVKAVGVEPAGHGEAGCSGDCRHCAGGCPKKEA